MTVDPICLRCRHFVDDRRWTCAAFPRGIPGPILVMEADHREPYPGDGGIRFEPRPEPETPPKP
ncbi:MAG: hypothetical protein BGO49_04355 [Planctomycetales bacterium 71-10]|nr:MAG: hypothetical protein BGO49_04355 [Planctomycetales bacterium 71-10]